MASENDQHNITLEVCFCFLLIGYIAFYLGQQHPMLQPSRRQHQTQRIEDNYVTHPAEVPNSPGSVTSSTYDEGFQAGSKSGVAFEIHELKRALEKNRDMEKRLEKKVKELVEKEAAMKQSIDALIRECRAERKGWLEDQYRVVWEEKRANEKGVKGWFGWGLGKKSAGTPRVDREEKRRGSEGDVDWGSCEKEKW